MKYEIKGSNFKVIREPDEPKIYKETEFWYKLKKVLIANGYDVIKKVMSKDGHLYGGNTYPYYIRGRKINDETPMIYDGDYALRFVYENFNNKGEVHLLLEGKLESAHKEK